MSDERAGGEAAAAGDEGTDGETRAASDEGTGSETDAARDESGDRAADPVSDEGSDGETDAARDEGAGGGRDEDRTPWLELAIGGIGALLLLLMVGYLLHDAFGGGEERPVDFALEPGAFVERADGWRVPVRVRNLGDRPAGKVGLHAELELAGGETEEATLVVEFLPPRGTVDVVFLFERNPDDGELRLRATGYLEP